MPTSTLKDRLLLAMAGPPRLSQSDLARACGIRPASVNNWVSGKTKTIEGANLLNAARALNVNPDWLATGRGDREPLRGGEESANHLLGKTVTSGLAGQGSQPVILDPQILVAAEQWVAQEEGPVVDRPDGTRGRMLPYDPPTRAERLSALIAMLTANGGTLHPDDAGKLLEAARARLRQGEGSDRGEVGAGTRRAAGR